MKNHTIRAVMFALIWIASTGCSAQAPRSEDDPRHQIARHYGIDGFDRIEAIRFTFNARVGAKQVRRAWLWKPGTGEVTHWSGSQSTAETFTHPLPAGTIDARARTLDAQFVNDRYWLLFPLHLVWDQTTIIEDHGQAQRPLGAGQARRIEVRYPSSGGYTPGDAYDLFIEPDGRIAEWVYRRGGVSQPTRMSSWEDHRRLGPLLIALDHHGPDGFRIWFSEVALKHVDGDSWIYPEV